MKPTRIFFLSGLILLVFSPCLHAGWRDGFGTLLKPLQKKSLNDTQIGQGLREALKVGIDSAVSRAGAAGGYAENPRIRIGFPPQLSLVEKGLRAVGMGSRIDDFEVSVNRAAEAAAPQAKGALVDALMGMTIEDAQTLLKGGDTAATDFFRKKTWDQLYQTVSPIMRKNFEQYAVTQKYDQALQAYNRIPLAMKPKLVSADEYGTTKALDGLFTLIAEEEKKIRTDPAARVTGLLQTVFSSASK